jgi:MFS family permease
MSSGENELLMDQRNDRTIVNDLTVADGQKNSPITSSDRERRSALLIVFLVMFIDLIGFALVLPLLPLYGKDFLDPLLPPEGTSQGRILRGLILGALMASFSLMQFVFAPLWGRVSDRHGRRPFLILGLIGSVASYALFGFASDWGTVDGRQLIGLIMLFAGRIGAGIAGATVSTAQAVIADCTTAEKRSHGMALIGAAFGIGFMFGPIIGGAARKFFPDFRGLPGYAAAALSFTALLVTLFMMPETWRPGAKLRKRGWFNLDGIRLAMATPTVFALILIYFLCTLAFGNFETTLAFLNRDILGLPDQDNLWVFAYVGLILTLAQVVYRALSRRGIVETRYMFRGVSLMTLGLGLIGVTVAFVPPDVANQSEPVSSFAPWALVLCMTAAVVGFAFVNPSVTALISRRTDPARQGEILGVNQSANALSRILGPVAGIGLYYQRPTHVLPYAFAVSLLAIVFCLTVRVRSSSDR